ncbi:Hypothetical predicted protein [Mytilus galloprovincialis]|uniref:C1q domain-containing protein n=1 Tax=Mytilus galloprovincialis TaxID=29158 RepID=A0A8B6FQI5_MYTGA|nr:Hypothetical predicted protein [Mytilus galloprovincialis]
MENSVVVLLLSVFILFGALYVHIVDQRIMQRKDELHHPAKSGCCDSCPMYADLKAEVDDLKAANIPVAFYAYLSANIDLSSVPIHSIIKYDVVDLNLGNGYDASSGQFTAPSDGLYVIHITTGARDSSHAVVELISNGVIKDITWADSFNHIDRTVATTVTPLDLRKGDKVNARIGSYKGGAVLESTNFIRCSFSGFKLH